ncbi:MAG: FAD-dependent oxidoreductase [Hyphomonadaceae bacterium]
MNLTTTCCVAGGGPAGLMTGYLLARQGVDVIVLEKHKDFLRDFRGDTVHPSTLGLFDELGLLEGLLARPHEKTESLSLTISGRELEVIDFRGLSKKTGFIAMMPQWEFLNFLSEEATKLPTFRLMMETEATSLIETETRVTGVEAMSPDGALSIQADLVIAADGRGSVLRDMSGLPQEDLGSPIDVLWMSLSKTDNDPGGSLARIDAGGFMVMINRGDYWQCAFLIRKGGMDALRAAGLEAFRERIKTLAPMLDDRLGEIRSWEDVKLLTVKVDRLTKWWRTGLLCIGDASHAMSPVGGVGINLAIQDAVATARMLGSKLKSGTLMDDDLAAVQKRRDWPARMTQRAQVFAHRNMLEPTLDAAKPLKAPMPLRLLNRVPILRGIPARAVGIGLRPEHWPKDLG